MFVLFYDTKFVVICFSSNKKYMNDHALFSVAVKINLFLTSVVTLIKIQENLVISGFHLSIKYKELGSHHSCPCTRK